MYFGRVLAAAEATAARRVGEAEEHRQAVGGHGRVGPSERGVHRRCHWRHRLDALPG